MLDRPQRLTPAAREALEAPPSLATIRACGGVRVRFGREGARTVRLASAESGGYRARFPTRFDGACEAVLINTGGGMTGGDRLDIGIEVGAGADAVVTSQAAEKIYRTESLATGIAATVSVGAGASLHWLPQETILFDGASLKRSLTIDLAADANLIACESLFFGRAAMGERWSRASLADRWRIRRSGRLVFAEDLRLAGDVGALLNHPGLGGGARAVATAVIIAPGAQERLEEARAAMADSASESGASALDGLIVARFLSPDAAALRADLARFVIALTGRAPPRSWQV